MHWGQAKARGHQIVCALGVLLLTSCLSDRPLRERFGLESDRADDAVGFVTISTPLFTPLDDPVGGKQRLRLQDLMDWEQVRLSLTAASFGAAEANYDMFSLGLALQLATISENTETNQSTTAPPAPAPAPPADGSTPPTNGGTPPENTEPTGTTSRSNTTKTTSPTQPTLPTVPRLTDAGNKKIYDALLALLKPSTKPFTLPPDVLATLTASLHSYMVNIEEFYNVEGFDYEHGLSGSYVPYKVHFTVTAEPGWYSRYLKYDAVVDVELNLVRDTGTCATGTCDDQIIVLHVSPLETAQSITEFSAAMTEFATAVQVAGSVSADVSINAQTQRLSAAAEQLQGVRAHNTLAVGFPASNRIRVRFLADRVGTTTGRDLQPTARVLTATVLVPTAASGQFRLDARRLYPDVRKDPQSYQKLLRSVQTKDTSNLQLRAAIAKTVDLVRNQVDAVRKMDGRTPDPFVNAVIDEAANAVREGETTLHILRPLVTLLRDQVPQRYDSGDKALVIQALQDVTYANRGPNSGVEDAYYANWGSMFNSLRSLSGDEVILALCEASGAESLCEREEPKQPTAEQQVRISALAYQIKKIRLVDFEDQLGVLAGLSQEARRAWITAKTIQVIDRMLRMEVAFDQMHTSIEDALKQVREDLGPHRERVRKLLCGAQCDVNVNAFFAPTMFGAAGDVSPPRELMFGIIEPSDKRVVVAKTSGARVAPIPPWMGPLDDQLAISKASGVYGTSPGAKARADLAVQRAEAHLTRVKADMEAQDKGSGTPLEQAQTRLDKLLTASGDRLAPKQMSALSAAGASAPNHDALLQAVVEAVRDRYAEMANYADRTAMRDILLAAAAVRAAAQPIQAAEAAVAKAQAAAAKAAALASAGGRATVRMQYTAPGMLLDDQEQLIHATDVYARVLGLGTMPCDAEPAARACATPDDPGVCAPGAFCRLVAGRHEAVLEVQGIDLGLVLGASRSAQALRAYVQIVAVPMGVDPDLAWSRGSAQVTTAEVLLEPQKIAPPVPAKPDDKKGAN